MQNKWPTKEECRGHVRSCQTDRQRKRVCPHGPRLQKRRAHHAHATDGDDTLTLPN